MSVVVVTGGTHGIGRGIVHNFAEAGWQVGILDIDAISVAESTSAHDVLGLTADVTSLEQLSRGMAEIRQQFGQLDALVTSAGLTRIGPSDSLPVSDWERVIDVDLSGTFYACQAAKPHMKAGGAMVTVASIAAFRGFAERAAYCSAKAGVVALTRVLATEWASDGIRVNAVAPGWVDTPLVQDAAAHGHVDLEQLASRPPMKRLAYVSEVADTVRFLVEGPEFITGQTVCVDGGYVWSG